MSGGKDSNGDKTDRIIQDALAEEQKEKRKRKGAKGRRDNLYREYSGELDARPKQRKKDEVAEEIGPIKESLVLKAQSVRAARRKGKGIGDTGILDSVEQAEELQEMPDAEKEKEHGIELEAFNLEEERQKGYFDEAGNYVENPEVDDEGEVDAWLQSDEAKVMDEVTRKKVEAKQKQEAIQLEKSELSVTDISRLQYKVSKILQEGETVAAALKRLAGPRKRLGRKSKQPQELKQDNDASDKKKSFEDLTEASTMLMEAGETDVYMKDKSYFQRAAAVYIDLDEGDAPTGTGDPGMNFNVKSGKAYEDADEDMFGDDSSEEKEAEQTEPLRAATTAGQDPDTSDYASWPIKELKRFCEEHGKSYQGITEKDDLVRLAAQCATDSKANEIDTDLSAPAGYAFDPNSGLWWSSESQLYFDPKSGYYLNPTDSKWYAWNSKTQQWIDLSNC